MRLFSNGENIGEALTKHAQKTTKKQISGSFFLYFFTFSPYFLESFLPVFLGIFHILHLGLFGELGRLNAGVGEGALLI